MRVAELDLPGPALEFLGAEGYEELYPPQAKCAAAGLTEGRSLMVSAPTASGKTLIATIAVLACLAGGRGKAVYLTPLRALAAEKHAELRKIEGAGLGRRVRVGMSTGDPDDAGRGLGRYDVLVLTNERMDSLMRRGPEWLDDVALVVADEVHLIGDPGRGPTLEMVLTALGRLARRPQVVALSATVTNAAEVAGWLGAELVEDDWRPVPLTEGVYDGGVVSMSDGRRYELEQTLRGPAVDLGAEAVRGGGQALVFADTRARSASLAAKAAEVVSREVAPADAARLKRASRAMLASNEGTKAVRALAALLPSGVAFHHAGLSQGCRRVVEDEFRRGGIRLLCSTPTLAAGVNLPARRVVVSSVTRYDARAGGSAPISVMEYKQLCGRAGRPQYDEYGEAVIVAGRHPPGAIEERYIDGEPEPVESRITEDRALRTHALAAVASSPGISEDGLAETFAGTLGGLQAGGPAVRLAVRVALRFLRHNGLVKERGGRLAATPFGRKASELYLDPLTAVRLRDAAAGAPEGRRRTLGILHLLSGCDEFFPRPGMRQADLDAAAALIESSRAELLSPVSVPDCNRGLLALHAWVSESSEASLSERLGIEAGDMHRMAETAGWLAHCLRELSRLAGRADLASELGVLRRRLAYGVREDLVGLVSVRGVGRVRARALHRAGIRTVEELAAAPPARVAAVGKIGRALAADIRRQLGGRG